jgi:selT/selW/selH-like putative selenoprotein
MFIYLQFVVMAIAFGAKYVKNYLRFIPESVFNFMESKMLFIIIINYFVLGQLSSYFQKTGAFEISINNQDIFSKLKNNTIPNYADVVNKIEELGFALVA